jgi:hypothetical protein
MVGGIFCRRLLLFVSLDDQQLLVHVSFGPPVRQSVALTVRSDQEG